MDVDDKEADVLLATLDPLAAMAEANEAKLRDLLAMVEVESAALRELASMAGPFIITKTSGIAREEVPWHYQVREGFGIWFVHNRRRKDLSIYYSWKQDPIEHRRITNEMAMEVAKLISLWQPVIPPNWIVTCPPQGASRFKTRDGMYPAGFLAKEVSTILRLDFVETLARQEAKKWHHPVVSLSQKPYVIIRHPVTVILVVDDMVSSSTTMRLSLLAFREAKISAFGFAWVG